MGERGHGKTYMLDQLFRLASDDDASGMHVFKSLKAKSGDSMSVSYSSLQQFEMLYTYMDVPFEPAYKAEPFFTWKGVVEAVVANAAEQLNEAEASWVNRVVASYDPELVRYLGLLHKMLPCLPEDNFDALKVMDRIGHMSNIIVALLKGYSAQFGHLLVMIHLQRDTSINVTELESW